MARPTREMMELLRRSATCTEARAELARRLTGVSLLQAVFPVTPFVPGVVPEFPLDFGGRPPWEVNNSGRR